MGGLFNRLPVAAAGSAAESFQKIMAFLIIIYRLSAPPGVRRLPECISRPSGTIPDF